MGLKRRTFLQQAVLALAALGFSETALSLLGDKSLAVPLLDRYFQALAQSSGRKLALLVGINQYPHSTALGGCVTDVALQRELLIHRFGFNTRDILTLTDSQGTRENIETAFIEHLTKQAKAGDLVVFHFSGYGSRVKMGEASQGDKSIRLSNSLVPVDRILQVKEAPTANDLLEETLVLLLRSLATDHVTTILDTSHTNTREVLQGHLRVRSCPNPPAAGPSLDELAFQEQIRLRLNTSQELLKTLNTMPGIVLTAAGSQELAMEAQWQGFSAGLFTYALTQHLWQVTPATTVQISLSRTAGVVNQLVGKEQQPRLVGEKSLDQPLAYYLPPGLSIGAEGVVIAVEDNGKTVHLWLAGLPAMVLEYYGINSLLNLTPCESVTPELKARTLNAEGDLESPQTSNPNQQRATVVKNPQLQLRSIEGLTAKARIIDSSVADNYQPQVGQLVQEAVRLLPRNLRLTVALDLHLERIERVDATSAFATIPSVSSVVVAGEQPADYLFGKLLLSKTGEVKTTDSLTNSASLVMPGSDSVVQMGGYGLFYLGGDPIHNTVGEAGEAVKSAVNRLTPKLKTLLAAKLLRLTANEGSSWLGVRVSLEMVAPEARVVMQRETFRASLPPQKWSGKKSARNLTSMREGSMPTLPIGSRIQYRLENYSDRPIYFMLLGLDPSGNAIALYKIPSSFEVQESGNKLPLKDGVIPPGEVLTLPQSTTPFEWIVSEPTGLMEVQLICSRSPFTKAIKTLEATRPSKGSGEQIADLFNPLEVAQAVLQDLHQSSAIGSVDAIASVSDSYALDVNAWATLSFIYQVV